MHGAASNERSTEEIFVSAVAILRVTQKHAFPRLPVARIKAPDRICGTVQRVGYTGNTDSDLAIYRLKIKPTVNSHAMMLPGFFVVEQGVFRDYEQWKKQVKRLSGPERK